MVLYFHLNFKKTLTLINTYNWCHRLTRSQLNVYSSKFFLRHNLLNFPTFFFVQFSSVPFRLDTTKIDGCTKLVLLELFTEIRPTPEAKPEPMQRNNLTINNITRPATDEVDTWQAVLGKEPEGKIRMLFSVFYSD